MTNPQIATGAPMIRPATAADFRTIVALNRESVHFLSPLDWARLEQLDAQGAYHRVVERDGEVVAFLIALREGGDYDSPNYQWFCEHYRQFLYIDRVVVSEKHRGQGLGRMLYEDLFAFARETGIKKVAAEYDVEPPNEVSRAFHDAFNFSEVGRHWVAAGKKQVSLQIAQVV
jgi:predicted GNAT superfamily acetyltransferase